MSRDGRWQSFEDVETLFELSMIECAFANRFAKPS